MEGETRIEQSFKEMRVEIEKAGWSRLRALSPSTRAAKYTLWHLPDRAGPRGRVRGWNYALVYFAPWVSCKQLRHREPRLGGKITFPIHETSVIQGRESGAWFPVCKKHTRFLSLLIRLHVRACLASKKSLIKLQNQNCEPNNVYYRTIKQNVWLIRIMLIRK